MRVLRPRERGHDRWRGEARKQSCQLHPRGRRSGWGQEGHGSQGHFCCIRHGPIWLDVCILTNLRQTQAQRRQDKGSPRSQEIRRWLWPIPSRWERSHLREQDAVRPSSHQSADHRHRKRCHRQEGWTCIFQRSSDRGRWWNRGTRHHRWRQT